MASEGGGEDGARGMHEVRGTAQRVEAKGEAARETWRRGLAARGGGTVRAQHDAIRAGTQPSLRSERRDAFEDVSYTKRWNGDRR